MLITVWAIVIPLIVLLLFVPSFGSGSGGTIFQKHYVVSVDTTLYRPWLGKVSIQNVQTSVSSSIFSVGNIKGLITFPFGGKLYNVIVTDKSDNTMTSQTINLKLGQTNDIILKYNTLNKGVHDLNVKVVDAQTGELQSQDNIQVMVK